MPNRIRLRGQRERRNCPHGLGELSHELAIEIGKRIIHRLAIGHSNITGDDFASIFASAISGDHRASPLGLADVVWDGCAWTVKTVQAKYPFRQKSVRLISGRNNPLYSAGVHDVFEDIQRTGRAVLDVWNARVDESLHHHDDLRIFVFIRSMGTLEFAMFESEAARFIPAEYEWRLNKNRNFEGFDRETDRHCFTWQPHGAQFTVIHTVPASAYKFRIKQNPGIIEEHHVLRLIRYNDNWIEAVETEEADD